MEYLFYCRDRPGSWDLRWELCEEHWTFMDRYADGMIARGPTFTPDRSEVTGSLHLVDLPGAEAAREFAYEEPNFKAGVYGDVLIRRWRNVLGRTMWEYAGERPGHERFLILAHAAPGASDAPASLEEDRCRYLADGYGERLIAHGPLLADDGGDDKGGGDGGGDGEAWWGTAVLVELPDREAAEALIAADPYARDGRYAAVEIHAWAYGGRPQEPEKPQE